ncbi:MAG TPA: 3-isopropylmalate dehydratase small subunit [Steroidobacteraceae bacterium]|nr:3-isopropylmalate dehydratase small subunit [Steroidobacteraceae bacterium]
MPPIRQIRSRTVALPFANIDTDQIIPARFLRTTARAGLGRHLFSDWRYQSDGTAKPDFPLNQAAAQGCQILVAGRNFGCGSSREHAPWALLDYGFRAVISAEIADIFSNNALKNGLLPIVLAVGEVATLLADPGLELLIDLETNRITRPDGSQFAFQIERFARYCLLNGVDELGFLRSQEPAIARFESARA